MPNPVRFILLVLWLAFLPSVWAAGSDDEIKALLNRANAPEGVVFEIVSGERQFLESAMPRVRDYIKTLRQRFPALPVAVVTHGKEQFALMSAQEEKNSQVHGLVRQLSQEEDVPVHVCGTYAQMNDVAPEEFPDYVRVAAAGPAQIKDYEALGYVRVKVSPRTTR